MTNNYLVITCDSRKIFINGFAARKDLKITGMNYEGLFLQLKNVVKSEPILKKDETLIVKDLFAHGINNIFSEPDVRALIFSKKYTEKHPIIINKFDEFEAAELFYECI